MTTMLEHRLSTGSPKPEELRTPVKTPPEQTESPYSPNVSRYGRSHKPKMQDDYVSTDKKVSAYLKLSPGNQMQYFSTHKEAKKRASPKKSEVPEGTPRRGRPPKTPPKDGKREDPLKVVIKAEPQDPNSPVDGCEWMVGDLAWARVGGHPFWPCIIALDPLQKIFTKVIRKGRTMVSQRWVHVQFFGDNGRRSWLNTTSVMAYNGRDAFIQLGDTILAGMRKKEPKQTAAFVIKPAVLQVWEKAVQEAEDLINATREDRAEFFNTHFPPTPPPPVLTRDELIEKVLEQTNSPPKRRGRKRKIDLSTPEQETKRKQMKLEETPESEPVDTLLTSTPRTIADRKKRQALLIQLARSNQPTTPTAPETPVPSVSTSPQPESPPPAVKQPALKRPAVTESTPPMEKKKPKKKYTKKKLTADFQIFCSKQFDRVADDHPELNEKDINKYLQKMWNEMDETQKARYKSRFTGQEAESAEEISEDASSGSAEDGEEEVVSSKSSSPAPLALATQKPAAAKRNNCKYLFSGAKAEKVCQICEKTGDTVKCRGPCQGYYHPDCITNPPIPQPPVSTPQPRKGKRGRPKKNPESPGVSQPESQAKNPESPSVSLPENQVKDPESPSVSQSESQMDSSCVPSSEEDSKLPREEDAKGNVDLNDLLEKSENMENVELVEPAKMRKGSKDSESGEEGEGFRCKDCQEGRSQPCFICHEYIQKKTGDSKLYRCITAYCGKVYHEECLKPWPQSSWRSNGNGKGCERGVVMCPQHTCHTCVSDNPGVIKARYSNDKLVRCVRCPTSYHYGNYCLPAGSEILTNTQIICPQHYQPPKKALIHHVNAAWCFICASGGSLICCDLCPTSFHADCLNISTPPDGSYVCEDCLTGRFPLYGEIVWVKLGTYRWWPAEILYPALIPDNILNLPHVQGEFAVRFFGSHDHYWVNRGRVFLYQDGDTSGKGSYKKSSVDHMFERAVREASEAQRKYLEEKATRDAETRPGMKPPNYVKLKANRPVGNVRTMEMTLSSLTPCECDPKSEAPCAPDSDCLNRILMVECNPLVCPAGEKCCNQLFEKRQYPPLQPYQTQERGWGLKTLVPLKKGDFVIEYVGEMIDEEEYKKRLNHMHENNEENFYFLTIDKDRMLDAGPKGNVARFMNHSCQPNCETQKWTVNGDTRVGLFAVCDIPANTELVFNYNLESIGSDKKPCMCGAPNCSGFIGVKANKNQDKEESKEKKVVKKKKSVTVNKTHEEDCFICGEGGELLLCDGKLCTKGYHLRCLSKRQRPQGYWLCPWHQCNICNKGRVRRCTYCVNSFCQEHSDGNIHFDSVRGLVCFKHAQENAGDNGGEGLQADSSPTKITSVESEAMEIDSETSVAGSSESSVDSTSKVEAINNNVIKPVNSLRRRTRRSMSYTGDKSSADAVVNGAIEKLNKRKGRPSSVDDKLIASYEKTEYNVEQSPKPEETSENNVRDLINHVINILPIEENIEETENKNLQLESEIVKNKNENNKSKNQDMLNEREDLGNEDVNDDSLEEAEVKKNVNQSTHVGLSNLNKELVNQSLETYKSDEEKCDGKEEKDIQHLTEEKEYNKDAKTTNKSDNEIDVKNIDAESAEYENLNSLDALDQHQETPMEVNEIDVTNINANHSVIYEPTKSENVDSSNISEQCIETLIEDIEGENINADINSAAKSVNENSINVSEQLIETLIGDDEIEVKNIDADKIADSLQTTSEDVDSPDVSEQDIETLIEFNKIDLNIIGAGKTVVSEQFQSENTGPSDLLEQHKVTLSTDNKNVIDDNDETEKITLISSINKEIKNGDAINLNGDLKTFTGVEDSEVNNENNDVIEKVIFQNIEDRDDDIVHDSEAVKDDEENRESKNVVRISKNMGNLDKITDAFFENFETENNTIAEDAKVASEGSEHGDKQKEALPKSVDVDEPVEDFELSYSECSNDRVYKNSESSIEMKLTECASSESDDQITKTIEEINVNSDLANCIEQSNAMEVA